MHVHPLYLPGICTGLLLQNDMRNLRPYCLSNDKIRVFASAWATAGLHAHLFPGRPFVVPSDPRVSLAVSLRSRLRGRNIVVVLLLEQVTLDLGVLQKLKVALYQNAVSNGLHEDVRFLGLQMPFSGILRDNEANSYLTQTIVGVSYLSGARTSPGG